MSSLELFAELESQEIAVGTGVVSYTHCCQITYTKYSGVGQNPLIRFFKYFKNNVGPLVIAYINVAVCHRGTRIELSLMPIPVRMVLFL